MNQISIRTLAAKLDVPKEVIQWHIDEAVKNETLKMDQDVFRIGRGYGLSLDAVIWLVIDINVKDFRQVATIIRDISSPIPKEDIMSLKKIVDKMLGIEEPEELPKMTTNDLFDGSQQEYYDECMEIIKSIKKETGQTKREIVRRVSDIATKKYGIVWTQLYSDVQNKYGFTDGWTIKGLSNLQVVCFSDEQTKSIFKSILKGYKGE